MGLARAPCLGDRNRSDVLPEPDALIENYYLWAENTPWYAKHKNKGKQQSSTLYDTVAVYLAFAQDLCKMETLSIRVTDDGKTVVDDSAKQMRVATEWKNLGKFEDLLVQRLTGK